MEKKELTATEEIIEGIRHIAFGKSSDAVKLLLRSEELSDRQLRSLDLFSVTSLKRGTGGITEIKLMDRLKALELLARLTEPDGNSQSSFIDALIRSAENGEDEDD